MSNHFTFIRVGVLVHITFCSYEWLECVTYDAHVAAPVIVVAGDGTFLSKPTSDDLLDAVERLLNPF